MLTGSCVFFKNIKGFQPKDQDVIILVEPKDAQFKWMRQLSYGSYCTFEIVRRPKAELISHAVEKVVPMAIARFLTPEFAEEIGLTIDDLQLLKPMRDRLDDKHKYLGLIYDAYIENNSFTLTDEQRMKAYEVYKSARTDIYKEK